MSRTVWLFTALFLFAVPASAQDEPPDVVGDAEPAAPEVVQAWAQPERAAEASPGVESDAFAHIHDIDADLPELEAAQRMVGFDVMDGVR